MERQVANTNAVLGEVKGRMKNNIAEPSSAPVRVTHRPPKREVSPPGGRRANRTRRPWEGKQNRLGTDCNIQDNQTADNIKEMLKSNINPTEIKVGIGSLKTLSDRRVQIEMESIQGAETLTNNIREKLGDKMETSIQRPRKPRLKIHNVPEDISTDNTEDTLIAQNPDIGLERGEIIPKFTYETKKRNRNIDNRGQFSHKKVIDT